MQNQPRERIKRPEVYNQPEPEEVESEELTQDDLNEWLTQKVIRLELETFRKEAREGRSPLRQGTAKTIEKPKPIQPYERQYGPNQEETDRISPPPKKKGGMNGKRLVMLVIILAAACYVGYLAYQYLVLGYTFGG
jgi:hypothetical protein